MTPTAAPRSSWARYLPSILAALFVMVCAHVALGANSQDDSRTPLARNFTAVIGTTFFLLDLQARGLGKLFVVKGDNPESQSANANRKMVAGELRFWILWSMSLLAGMSIGEGATASLVNMLFPK